MSPRTVSKREAVATPAAPKATGRARRVVKGRALPTLRASTRRRALAAQPEAPRARRKAKRAKRAHGLGGRLAAAIRTARLRASRAAEDYYGRRR